MISNLLEETPHNESELKNACSRSILSPSFRLLLEAKKAASSLYEFFPIDHSTQANHCVYLGAVTSINTALQKSIMHYKLAEELLQRSFSPLNLNELEKLISTAKNESNISYILSSFVTFMPTCIERLATNVFYAETSEMRLDKFISQNIKDEIIVFVKKTYNNILNDEIRNEIQSIKNAVETSIRLSVQQIEYNAKEIQTLSQPGSHNGFLETAGDKDSIEKTVTGTVGHWAN
ncbi:hypothetical protein Sant_P0001 (plasmid) [Sodalis praecaptivus]|uniref:Uncharacterized protein n=1 Tax=Sodalis praecaptivus TaxID=1239307 RepID=W0I3K1_9GAMM|nr:hypothetical protein [Sodalis praecaptivus]AHF79050.1 hypothetical protein Sant_P0001 [Sodalis praecaptivus]